MVLFEPQTGLVFWTVVAFGVMVLILGRFALKPILNVLEQRETKIRESLETAEHTRMEAERLLREYEDQMARARSESQKIIAQGREVGENMKAEIVEKARQEAEAIVAKARREIERGKEEALVELQSEVASLSISIAARIMEESLDEKKHLKLVEKYLSEAKEVHEA